MSIIYNLKRKMLKRKLIGNLGKELETDTKIYSFVKKRKINSLRKDEPILCVGMPNLSITEKYDLNKRVIYIFNEIDFKDKVVGIFGFNDGDIVIKDCNINNTFYVNVNGSCLIENCKINSIDGIEILADDLSIKKTDIFNKNKDNKFEVNITSRNKVDILDSNIGKLNDNTSVKLTSLEKVNMINSTISGDNIIYESNTTEIDLKSLLAANNKIDLKTDDCTKEISNSKIKMFRSKDLNNMIETKEINNKRIDLINVLRNLKNECEKLVSNDKESIKELIKK